LQYRRTPLIQTLVNRVADWLGSSSKSVENSTKINLLRNYRLSIQVRCSVMASRTSNKAWSKDLDAGTYRNGFY